MKSMSKEEDTVLIPVTRKVGRGISLGSVCMTQYGEITHEEWLKKEVERCKNFELIDDMLWLKMPAHSEQALRYLKGKLSAQKTRERNERKELGNTN